MTGRMTPMMLEIFPTAIIFLILMLVKLKRWIQSTVGLSGSEANAMMILLPSMFVIIFFEPTYRWLSLPSSPIDYKEQMFYDSLMVSLETAVGSDKNEALLFHFDPNLSSLEELNSLGIPESISKRIIQYRNKGGKFMIKSDLEKVYGLDSALYQTLVPYIHLPDQRKKEEFIVKESKVKNEASKIIIQHDLNLADTTSLKSVKGIGSVLSKRIIKYRDGLGGFIQLNQLKEVYGLDSAAIHGLSSFFISDGFQPRKININMASENELASHPYISTRDAKSIITFRMQHGRFAELDDLLQIKILKESSVTRLGPYLSFE